MRNCIICGAPFYKEPLMICENMPESAQGFRDTKVNTPRGGIRLALKQCTGCGLIQFDCDPVPYYRDVIRAGVGSTIRELRIKQYRYFIEKYHLTETRIIEVGCGRGEFLEMLAGFPVQAFGIEHSKRLVQLAREKGLNVSQGFAENEMTRLGEEAFDAFLSFNFLEHQPDPNGMMRCIYRNLKDGGYGLITVPSFEYILDNCSFYELLRDHIANYTQDTLKFLMEKNGFRVLESSVVNRDTLMVIVQKKGMTDTAGLKKNYETLKEQFRAFFEKRAGKKIAVWGAGHQGLTTLSTMHAEEHVRYIIDSAPFKQGKYAPACGLPVVSPQHFFEEPADTILIIAPGYTEEIVKDIRQKFKWNVEIAVLRSASIELMK